MACETLPLHPSSNMDSSSSCMRSRSFSLLESWQVEQIQVNWYCRWRIVCVRWTTCLQRTKIFFSTRNSFWCHENLDTSTSIEVMVAIAHAVVVDAGHGDEKAATLAYFCHHYCTTFSKRTVLGNELVHLVFCSVWDRCCGWIWIKENLSFHHIFSFSSKSRSANVPRPLLSSAGRISKSTPISPATLQ